MAGVLFVVCVPSAKYEEELSKEKDKRESRPMQTSTPAEENDRFLKNERNFNGQVVSGGLPNETVILIQDDLCGDHTPVSQGKSGARFHDNSGHGDMLADAKLMGTEALKRSWDGFKELVGSGQNKGCKLVEEDDVKNDDSVPLEKVLRELLTNMGVDNAVWCDGKGGRYYQVLFSIATGAACEQALQAFADCGIGLRLNSVVSVIPCALHYHGDPQHPMHPYQGCDDNNGPPKSSAWDKFVQSVRARLTVAQVVESVKAEAAWTFDFMLLLIIAAFLAALGLVEDSTVFSVSSMLISPLMGPIIAGTFGTCIHDRGLMRLGVVNEMLGILLTMAIGFMFGLVICTIDDRYGVGEWPTNEMLSRCEIRSLWVGALVAFPSGAAGAIAVLGDNTGSLVGVAISASLLPPAVNAGLVWAMSFSYLLWQDNGTKFNAIIDTQQYSSNQAVELAVMGAISLCLTLVNVICIYAAGILVLKIKEVAPLRSSTARHFWRHDVKIARDYNRTVRGEEARALGRRLLNNKPGAHGGLGASGRRPADVNRRYSEAYGLGLEQTRLQVLRERLNQWTWSPAPAEPERPTLQELRALYESLTGERPDRVVAGVNRPRRFPAPLIRSTSGPNTWSPTAYPPDEPPLLESIKEISTDATLVKRLNRVSINCDENDVPTPTRDENLMSAGCTRRKFVVTPAKLDTFTNNNVIHNNSDELMDISNLV